VAASFAGLAAEPLSPDPDLAQQPAPVYVTRGYRVAGIRSSADRADMEIRKERISMMVALIALAVVMLIWVLVTWDEPAEQPAPERHRHV
jgi:hypothetical protein